MFLYFLQKKGIFVGNKQFMFTFWNAYRDNFEGNDEFYEKWLKVLFFEALNNNFKYPRDYFNLGEKYPNFNLIFQAYTPYLNGGLFKKNDLDLLDYKIHDSAFVRIFDFLESYNFTIREDTPYEQDLDINPEMLGNIYEMLVNVSEENDERHQAGIFYTPKVEIELMIRRAMVEFLYGKTKIDKNKLYLFVFHEKDEEIVPTFQKDEIEKLLNELNTITIVDPACGSGHYLVVAAQILWELKKNLFSQFGKKIDKLEEKKKIIENSIYGVDVKDWAVEIAKLRLWLDLIVDAEIERLKINEPLLPSLSFKIRVGDSIVQKIGKIYFSPKKIHGLSPSLRALLINLKESKQRFFRNDPYINEERIRSEEKNFFIAILDEEINKIKQKQEEIEKSLFFREQEALFPGHLPQQMNLMPLTKLNKELKSLQKQQEELKKQKEVIKNTELKTAFWPIEFVDVFAEKKGFDIVIANPPYVRQQLIADPSIKGNQVLEQRQEYKQKLLEQIQNDWNDKEGKIINIQKKADLYVYFYLKGLKLLNADGVMCFISSNSWLDVDYGKNLQEIMLKYVPIIAIYDNQVKRSFKHADVNTIIAIFKAPLKKEWENNLKEHLIKFVNFKKTFEEILYSDVFIEIEKINKRTTTETFQVHPITQWQLYLDGLETPKINEKTGQKGFETKEFGVYAGNKWGGKYLRAPDIYWRILEKGKGKLVRLGDIAKVEGYIHGFNVGDEFPKAYFIESLKYAQTIYLDEKSNGVVSHGVKNEGNSRILADLLFPRMIGDRFAVLVNYGKVYGQKFYKIILNDKKMRMDIGVFMNSTIQMLQNEITMYSLWGLGALSVNSDDIKQVYVFKNPTNKRLNIKLLYKTICSIFTELGFDPNKPIRSQEPSPLPDRKALDDIVFDALELTEEERKEVYWAVAELVKNRLEKAKNI
jgi:hypothetical protein